MASLETIMENAIAISLDIASREIADGFAARAGKFADRVRRNTLAVMAVNHYLSWQGIKTDLMAGNSWHPGLRLVADVADLQVVGLGRLECRVIAPGATKIEIPLEVSEDRVAYMVLELSEQPLSGKLLGLFIPGENPVSSIALSDLIDMDESIEYLTQLESAKNSASVVASGSSESIAEAVTDRVIEIGQWFNGTLDRVSESLNGVLIASNLMPSATRSGEKQSIREMVNKNKNKEIVPADFKEVRYQIDKLYSLHILTWILPSSLDKWAILAAVVSEQPSGLPVGLSINIDDINRCVEQKKITEKNQKLLYISVKTEDRSEKITVSIISAQQESIFSHSFVFNPNDKN